MLDPMKPIIMHKNDALQPIVDEFKQVINSKIQMDQIPDKFRRVTVKTENKVTILSEIAESETIKNINQYKVFYNVGNIEFHPSREGQKLYLNYSGTGYTMISTERIYHSISPITQEIETMKDIIDDTINITEEINEAISNANSSAANVNNKITEMNTFKTNLENAETERINKFNNIKVENSTIKQEMLETKKTLETTNTNVNNIEVQRIENENIRKTNEERRIVEHTKRVIKAKYSVDKSIWTDVPTMDSKFIKISLDNGETWKESIRVKGEQGIGLNLKGSLPSVDSLPNIGQAGECYLIQGNLYVWDIINNIWVNGGNIKGEKGNKGDIGEKGNKGDTGLTPNIQVGKVTTLDPTQPATVIQRGTIDNPIFDFGLPKGKDGLGSGDMNKSTYDKDEDGIVDNAKKANGYTIESNVPRNAIFTDTIYNDAEVKQSITNINSSVNGLSKVLDLANEKINEIPDKYIKVTNAMRDYDSCNGGHLNDVPTAQLFYECMENKFTIETIVSSTDLNNCTNNKALYSGRTSLNSPPGVTGDLKVIFVANIDGNSIQFAFVNNGIYKRIKSYPNGTWGLWTKFSEDGHIHTNMAQFKNGNGTFSNGQTTCTITDSFITQNTLVTVIPTETKKGTWTVKSNNNNFVITSSEAEPSNVTFDWGGVK